MKNRVWCPFRALTGFAPKNFKLGHFRLRLTGKKRLTLHAAANETDFGDKQKPRL